MTTATATSFAEINAQARPYPSWLLPDGGSGLAIFSAAFLGWNDVIHLARAKMTVTCVDTNADRLWEMATVYPLAWEWRVEDGWEFAESAAAEGRQWDVVTVDPFFEDMARKAWASLGVWLSLAKDLVTLTVHADTELDLPEGWTQSYFPRGEDVGWAVLRHA